MSKLAAFQQANSNYFSTGVSLLELAEKAPLLYSEQNYQEKGKLLKILQSNCVYKDGKLFPEWRKPFDLLASVNVARQAEDGAEGAKNAGSTNGLPTQDDIRTFWRENLYELHALGRHAAELCPV